MNLTEELIEEIDGWLNNRMNPAEQAAFQQRLAQDAELRQEVEVQRRILQGLEAVAMKRQLATMRKGIGRERQLRRASRTVGAFMLTVFLFLGGFYLFQYSQKLSSQEVAMQYGTESPTLDDADLTTDLTEAINNYYAGQYQQALSQLAVLPTDSLRLVPYYRGLSLLALNRSAEAINALAQAWQSPSSATRQKAEWFTAMTYLKADDADKGREILRAIRDGKEDHLYKELATEVLDKLR
jgi:hypothetical protein